MISGGQSGADLAGILAAERCKIKTGGVVPKGYRTEKGNQPILGTRFGLTEHVSSSYLPRTKSNIINSDVTIILSPKINSAGTIATIKMCETMSRGQLTCPHILVSDLHIDNELVLHFLRHHNPSIINVAGNRESVCPGLTASARDFLIPIFSQYKIDTTNKTNKSPRQ